MASGNGGAPSLLRAVAGKALATKPKISGKNHSGSGVGISISSFRLWSESVAGSWKAVMIHFPFSSFRLPERGVEDRCGGRRGEDALASQRVPPEAGSWKLEIAHIWCLITGETS
jgi:hypothetical protein